jgi:glucose-1-phosphate cytidylyltransferase
MKVVLFCGGLGTRLREHSETIPKPLVNVGVRPLIWHLMKYYAHFGHKDFVLALGYRGDMIRDYFLNYSDCLSTDFTWSEGGHKIQLHGEGISDWRITFVDTGMHSNLGERLLRVREYVKDEPWFLANYSDGLSDLPLTPFVQEAQRRDAIASFVSVRPPHSFHSVACDSDGLVTELEPMSVSGTWINGGYFALKQEVFDYILEGEEFVEEPFARLIAKRKLWTQRHTGFWASMDTFKDKIRFDRLEAKGQCPWKIWRRP